MGKNKNYGEYFKPKHEEQKIEEVQTTEETVETPQEETPVEEPKVEEPKLIKAVVTGAKRVNVRKDPAVKEGNVVAILDEGTEVYIIPVKVTDPEPYGWKKIRIPVANVNEGYMMPQYLKEI